MLWACGRWDVVEERFLVNSAPRVRGRFPLLDGRTCVVFDARGGRPDGFRCVGGIVGTAVPAARAHLEVAIRRGGRGRGGGRRGVIVPRDGVVMVAWVVVVVGVRHGSCGQGRGRVILLATAGERESYILRPLRRVEFEACGRVTHLVAATLVSFRARRRWPLSWACSTTGRALPPHTNTSHPRQRPSGMLTTATKHADRQTTGRHVPRAAAPKRFCCRTLEQQPRKERYVAYGNMCSATLHLCSALAKTTQSRTSGPRATLPLCPSLLTPFRFTEEAA